MGRPKRSQFGHVLLPGFTYLTSRIAFSARLGHAPHQRASLRALYGLTDTRNSFHGSDGVESARKELALFFDDARCDESLDLN